VKLFVTENSMASELCESVEMADNLVTRFRGLLGRRQLPPTNALWLRPCNSIHTFFMKFSIDVLFLDKENRIIDIARNIPPYRVLSPRWRAASVIEMSAGSSKAAQVGMVVVCQS
jgi:uncharacterized membrane protein (UPF0127 family)